MYTRSMETIYLSLRAQVAVGTFFIKSPVYQTTENYISLEIKGFRETSLIKTFVRSYKYRKKYISLSAPNIAPKGIFCRESKILKVVFFFFFPKKG